MKLHYLEKKYGIRINLLNWSGGNYETGTLNALLKIADTDSGRILLECISYYVRHHPLSLPHGVLEIRPYADGGCQAEVSSEKTTEEGARLKPVVHFWPKAFATGGVCAKYLENHRDESILPDETLFHELVHALRMASAKYKVAPLGNAIDTNGFNMLGLIDYDDVEEFIAILVTNIYITDPSNKSHSNLTDYVFRWPKFISLIPSNKPHSPLRRDHVSFRSLESDLAESFTFFRSSVETYSLVEQFCRDNPSFTKKLAAVKASFNPIGAYYQDPMQAWIYANSNAAVLRDALGPSHP
jgi:hypothetical protein